MRTINIGFGSLGYHPLLDDKVDHHIILIEDEYEINNTRTKDGQDERKNINFKVKTKEG